MTARAWMAGDCAGGKRLPAVALLLALSGACGGGATSPATEAGATSSATEAGAEPARDAADRADTPGPQDAPVVDAAPSTAEGPVAATASADGGAEVASVVPEECRVAFSGVSGGTVTFRVTNDGPQTVYLIETCAGVAFGVSSCASRYTDDVGPLYACACGCQDPSCTWSIACPACPPDAPVPLAPGASRDLAWSAQRLFTERRSSYLCLQSVPLPPEIYSVTIPVVDSPESVDAGASPSRRVTRTFAYTGEGLVVPVSISGAADGGAPDAPAACEAATAVCAAPWTSPCNLDTTYQVQLSSFYEVNQWTLEPPATFSRHRVLQEGLRDPGSFSCTNPLPRCGTAPDVFTTGQLMEAMAAPDVQAAFLTRATFGIWGPGSLSIRRGAGPDPARFDVGADCDGTGFCEHPITGGIARVAALLRKIEQQQIAAPGCEAFPSER
jgi:hypothetical protein